jgi:hypothetical protein
VADLTTDVPPLTTLEQRAFEDLALGSCHCAPPVRLGVADIQPRTDAQRGPHGAALNYCERCFGHWLRARLMEHWRGDRYWKDLDRGDFGLLRRPFHPNQGLVADIVILIMTGNENLTIVTWALETGRPLDQVVEILTVLDINARRLPPFPWMRSGIIAGQ